MVRVRRFLAQQRHILKWSRAANEGRTADCFKAVSAGYNAGFSAPASCMARLPLQTDAMLLLPLLSVMLLSRRTVYGKSSCPGTAGASARSASMPCPTSRRPAGPNLPTCSPAELRSSSTPCSTQHTVQAEADGASIPGLRVTTVKRP